MGRALLVAYLSLVTAAFAADAPKLTADELVARHLASMGGVAARNASTCSLDAAAHFGFVLGGTGDLYGKARFFSEGRKLHLVMNFDNLEYRGEDIVSDGDRAVIAVSPRNDMSWLGSFLKPRHVLLKEGLFGGTLSTAWPLLDLPSHRVRLHYTGIKKIDGVALHELRYEPRNGSEGTDIRLYFEPETYRHVMTIYTVSVAVIDPRSMEIRSHARNVDADEGRQIVRETFSDFHTVDGVTLPRHWTIDFTNQLHDTRILRWDLNVSVVYHLPIDPAVFNLK